MTPPSSPPEVLLRATSRARALRGRALVVKLGGSAMEDPAATRGTLESVVCLQTLGVRLVLVHGGGKPIDRAMAAAGLEPRKVAGRRYTDGATLRIVVRVLRDEVNAGLVESLDRLDLLAMPCPEVLTGSQITLPGPDGKRIDLGRVGNVTEVNAGLLDVYLEDGVIPVIPSIAKDSQGHWLNVNADTAAAAVAGSVKAEACYFLTDTPGVLRDVNDPASLIRRLTRAECEHLIRDGMIAGGMIPKVEACFEALDAGAGRAVILDGRKPHALLGEFVSENLSGTAIVN